MAPTLNRLRFFLFGAGFLFFHRPLAAGELALYHLNNASLEYEGTGFRQVDEGWELKVKPRGTGEGLRWRHSLSPDSAVQLQYWRNNAFYAREDGNIKTDALRQNGDTRLSVQALMADLRRPLAESRWEVFVGIQGVHEIFHRKAIIFNLAPEPNQAKEVLSAAGAYIGFHRGSQDRFFWDGEASIGHLFLTRNRQSVEGGSIHRSGYAYSFRLEAGYQRNRWRLGLGFVRHLFQIMVPGGKSLPSGAAASLPINKTDFYSPVVAVTYVY
jgi:hypothetical protein